MADAPWLYIHWLSWTLWLHVTLGLQSLWFIVIERVLMIVSVSYELLISNLKLKDFNAYHSNIHCIISLCVDNKADAMKPNPNLRKKERRVTNYNIIVDRWAGANNPHAHTHARTCTRTHMHVHAQMRAHTHTYTHTNTHTHTHTHMQTNTITDILLKIRLL